MKKRIILISFIFLTGFGIGKINSYSLRKRIEFEKWPSMKFKNIRILIAKGILSNQGFAGVYKKEMENTIIIFPEISENTVFTNEDQGFGPVKEDIKIYYLDRNFNIIKSEIIKKEKGISIAPKNTFIAIEGLP